MTQYREIFTIIDSAKGTLISPDGAKISRDDLLPRLILADEVIFHASFVTVKEENNVISTEPESFDNSMMFKIIGDADNDNTTEVMFSYAYLPEKSDPVNGKLAFHIKSSSTRFADAIKNVRSKKCDFVILGIGADSLSTVVLAKDQFIAENRPCENTVFEDIEPEKIMSREELQLLLNLKSPLEHTHNADDIIGFEAPDGTSYSAGTGIEITEDNVINCTIQNSGNTVYTAGYGINISDDNIISCTVSSSGGGDGTDYVTQEAFDTAIGDINSILDDINGEEV